MTLPPFTTFRRMKSFALCAITLFFASVARAQGFLYVQSASDTLTAIPSEFVTGYEVFSGDAYVMLTTGKTLIVRQAEDIGLQCPVELPCFSFYSFNKADNDQLFKTVTAPAEELSGDTIRLSIGQIGKSLTASFRLTDPDAAAWVDTVRQNSRETRQRMAEPVTYTLGRGCWRQLRLEQDEAGSITYRYVPFGRQTTVSIDFLTDHPTGTYKLYNVPRINIKTDTGAIPLSKEKYISGTITIFGCGVYPDMPATDILIKGRGNSSWSSSSSSKNPYHFKFAEKQRPLGMTAGKHWILLSNKQTGSMLCNAIEQKASSLAGCAATCHIVPVELYINGSYRGSYNLTEKVGFYNNSVSLGDESRAAMLELDTYEDEPIWSDNAYHISTKIHAPDFDDDDSLLAITQADIIDYWNEATYTLRYGASEDYTRFFDVDRLVSYLFANELCYNTELQHPKSVFLYSDNVTRGDDSDPFFAGPSPWVFGPMWDCDWSFGYQMGSASYFVNGADMEYYNGWIAWMVNGFWRDLRFRSQDVDEAYRMLWHKFMTDGRLEELIDYVWDYYEYAAPSLKHNSYSKVTENDASSYAITAKRAQAWLRKRASYVYGTLGDISIDNEEKEPVPVPHLIDTEDALRLSRPDMAQHTVLYDLQGRRIPLDEKSPLSLQRPSLPLGIYITSSGRKVLVK